MSVVADNPDNDVFTPEPVTSAIARFRNAVVSVGALALVCAFATPAYSDSVTRSTDVAGTPASVWSLIGPFCAIKDWHPAVGTCIEDGRTPPTRTLVTKDGKATFVELQTARSDAQHRYSYTFQSSPLPVTNYLATIAVAAKGNGVSTVTWTGSYTPVPGKEKDASDALGGIYQAGLDTIKSKLAR